MEKRCQLLLSMLLSFLTGFAQAEDSYIIIGEETTVYGHTDIRNTNYRWQSNNPSDLQIVSSSNYSCKVRGISYNPHASVTQSWTTPTGGSGSMDFTVSVFSDKPESLDLSVKKIEGIDEGVEPTITASPSPKKATNYTLTWTALAHGGATSDVVKILHQSKESCTFKAMKAGEAYIKATTNNGVSASCYVSVFGINPESMSISGPETLYVGNSDELKMRLFYGEGVGECHRYSYHHSKIG